MSVTCCPRDNSCLVIGRHTQMSGMLRYIGLRLKLLDATYHPPKYVYVAELQEMTRAVLCYIWVRRARVIP